MSAVVSQDIPILRPLRSEDLRRVIEVENAAYEYPWTPGIFRDCLRVGYYCVVVELNGQVIGHGIMSVGVGECHLLNLCVHPDHQGCGLGTTLINYLLDVARWKSARIAFLEVRVSNEKAYRLYRNIGFEEIGIRKNYYPAVNGKREDARILTLELTC
ncbi:MAG: ribosomal protein S18-alanine N-acetyltransferase [Gammaproteobacteria bacterium]|nr:ribosomal protein S18-alanine N-acetyltransferase [Gammaproteobacteria bacterium]